MLLQKKRSHTVIIQKISNYYTPKFGRTTEIKVACRRSKCAEECWCGRRFLKKGGMIETEIWKWLGGLKIFAPTYLEQPTVRFKGRTKTLK